MIIRCIKHDLSASRNTTPTRKKREQTQSTKEGSTWFRNKNHGDAAIDDKLADVPTVATGADVRKVKAEAVIAVAKDEPIVGATQVAVVELGGAQI